MNKLLVLSALILSACGQQTQQSNQDPRSISGMDPVLAAYRDEFIAAKGRALDYDIPMQFSTLTYPIVGMCTRWSNGYRQLQIDPTYWASITVEMRVELVFHELGHCDLNRGHTLVPANNTQPTSFMNPYTFWYADSQLSSYVAELFSPSAISSTPSLSDTDCVHDIEVK